MTKLYQQGDLVQDEQPKIFEVDDTIAQLIWTVHQINI